ncbi:S41 family peptidase [Nonlabens ponticola]|uniref:Tricorn protease homolog n=1 Tax=Nonlabens ponticola TaxID=2496866 RepID=A0A3S9N0I8_9FLAO|nr:S41 family peptidase [Nonlabens ponticola]AZQ44940.1 protease [Nonlabens ponticola]
MRYFFTLFLFSFILQATAQETKLLRQPTIHGDQVAFVYANDLWKTSINGGDVQRLTSHEGYESSPHFSRDGKHIAFTAQYDGNVDVFVIPSQGGTPQRVTYHPASDHVQGWTPDGKILFRSNRESRPTETNKFYTIGINENFPKAMPLTRAAYGDISEDGKHVAYTPITSWDPEWRNYRGGQAMPIWIVNLETLELQTTSQPTKERHLDPVWLNGVVYYLSERDYTSNIWSYNPQSKEEKQITFHKKFDVKSLDADDDQIVYEHGGTLKLVDPSTMNGRQLSITVNADLNFSRPRWIDVEADDLRNARLSPNGQRAIFEHRGEVLTFPKKEGSYRNLTQSSSTADRAPIWSPQGDRVAYFSDASGEYELIIADQKGTVLKKIAFDDPTFYFEPDWSPDGKYLSFTDTHYNIWITDISSGSSKIVATDRYAHPNRSMNPTWSPDSQWIAYAKQQESHFKAIFAYNNKTGKTIQITDPLADAISPVWDAGGKYLYTLASTDYGLKSGWLDMSSYDPSTTRNVYAVVLSSQDESPLKPLMDEEKELSTKETKKKKDKKDKSDPGEMESKMVTVNIDENGIYNRAVALDIKAANYVALMPAPKNHVFIAKDVDSESGYELHRYNVKDKKLEEYATGVNQATVSSNREHVLLNKGNSWMISAAAGKVDASEDKINTTASINIDPREEYEQIFKEGWRYMRDFLYVDNVHGAPWDDIYKWYAPWIKHVRHRTDLNYVVDIMSGEVAIGHSYVSGGDLPDVDRVNVGLLGVDLELDGDYYKITKIYNGEQWNPETNAPLAIPGMDVKAGDYLLAINGRELDGEHNPYYLLQQTANREIYITVADNKSGNNKRELLVKPIYSENGLRYVDWVEGNRRKVDELSNGKLAYVYVPNTSNPGFTSFNRYYFSQQDKKGVVIDERNNGGGSAADYMIDVLNRKPIGYFNSKANDRRPWTTPMAGIFGPKVMIINERAGSGGDLLPYMFKQQEIGPLIGTRTWGGLVGTWDTPPFIDGGRMVAPRGGFYDLDGEWAVEGEGIAPDIKVIQTPKLTAQGNDPQLERAVQEAMELLKTQEFNIKPEPTAPVRWKRPAGYENDN